MAAKAKDVHGSDAQDQGFDYEFLASLYEGSEDATTRIMKVVRAKTKEAFSRKDKTLLPTQSDLAVATGTSPSHTQKVVRYLQLAGELEKCIDGRARRWFSTEGIPRRRMA